MTYPVLDPLTGAVVGNAVVQMTPARLLIDGLDCSGQGDDGVQLVFNTIPGWFGGAGVRTGFQDRSNDHGSFDAPVYRGSRVVTITGWAWAASRNAVAAKLQQFTATLADGRLGTVMVDDPDYGTLWCQARLSDTPQIAWDANALAWTWQLQVTSPDPWLFGPPSTWTTSLPSPGAGGLTFPLFKGTGKLAFGLPGSSGSVVVSNPGNANAWPVFTVVGPVLGGFVLSEQESGRRVVYADDVPAGGVLVIDAAQGTAYLNGSDRTGELTVKQWWPVPPGGRPGNGQLLNAVSFTDNGDGTVTLSSPDLVDDGADVNVLLSGPVAQSTVQFNTLGPPGQTGQLTVTVNPTYW